jgi:mono/diheme cytochrome c family protein
VSRIRTKGDSESGREAEPTAGNAEVPIWLVVGTALLLYCGLLYLSEYAGGFHPLVYRPFRSIEEVRRAHPQPQEDARFTEGRRLYAQYCAPCHQPTGFGSTGIAPPLAGSEWVLAEGPTRLVRIVLHGVHGPLEVKGQDWNGVMPAFGRDLTDDSVAAVLTYIRGNKEWGNNASAVDAEVVRQIRERTNDRTLPWTARELLDIPDNN